MNVVVIGAGNIGTRHLQAISKCQETIDVYAVEPSKDARNRSEAMVMGTERRIIQDIKYCSSVENLPTELDVAVIATNSLVRRQAVEQLLGRANVKYMVLEKVLFTRVEDYCAVAKILTNHGVKAWVNCVRRSWPYMREMKKLFHGSTPVSLTVEGNMWGLGCNTIHFLDLLSWLTGTIGPVEMDISGLDNAIIASKRAGYIEFTGELKAKLGTHNLRCISHRDADFSGFAIEMESDAFRCRMIERGNKGKNIVTNKHSFKQWEEIYEVPYQSNLTNSVVSDLLNTGICALTPYSDSVKLHIPMLQAFMKKLNDGNEYCNIT